MDLKRLRGKLLLFSIVFAVLGIATSYQSDIPVQELKERYTYSDSKFIKIDGMPVHYRVTGSGEKTIVLLHGTASSLHTWEGWTNILRKNYRVVSMDLPGFGLTGPEPRSDYTLGRYLDFIEAVLVEIGVDKCVIGGNSFGGYLAWSYAVNHQDQVTELVVLNATGYARDGDSGFDFGLWIAGQDWAQSIMQNFTPRFLIARSVANVYFDDEKISDFLVDRYFHMLLREGNRAGLHGKMTQIKYDQADKIQTITCPTLILWGDHDNLVNVRDADRFHAEIPDADLIIYKDMGHIPMEEIPEQSCRDLIQFLEKG